MPSGEQGPATPYWQTPGLQIQERTQPVVLSPHTSGDWATASPGTLDRLLPSLSWDPGLKRWGPLGCPSLFSGPVHVGSDTAAAGWLTSCHGYCKTVPGKMGSQTPSGGVGQQPQEHLSGCMNSLRDPHVSCAAPPAKPGRRDHK